MVQETNEPKFIKMDDHAQTMIDSGVNVFAIQLVAESFAKLRGEGNALGEPLRFSFKGVRFTIELDPTFAPTLIEVKG